MREILFRGKRDDNGEWWFGDLMHTGKKCCIRRPKPNDTFNYEFYWVKPETIGQYTGLTDKNGKKIFEGDICLARLRELGTKRNLAVVRYGYTNYFELYDKHFSYRFTTRILAEIEVVGNIHDNPEFAERSN